MRNEAQVTFEVGKRVNIRIKDRITARTEARLHGWDSCLIRNRVLVSSTALPGDATDLHTHPSAFPLGSDGLQVFNAPSILLQLNFLGLNHPPTHCSSTHARGSAVWGATAGKV